MNQPVTFSDPDVDVNGMSDEFHDNLGAHIERHAPLNKVSQNNLQLKSKPWINDKIQKLIKQRDRLSRKFKRTHQRMNICIKSYVTGSLQKIGRAKLTISTATLLSIMTI